MTSTLATIAVLQWLILLTPGPNVLLVSHLAASGQRQAAYLAGFGITAVAMLWALLALLGIQALFAAQPGLRWSVQVVGGLYLARMAWRMWRAAPAQGEATKGQGASPLAPWSALQTGVITNLLNPKSALFYSSVFAAALPVQASALESATVVLFVGANALIWHAFLAGVFSRPRAQAAYARQQRALNRVAAACFGFFAARLLSGGLREAWAATR